MDAMETLNSLIIADKQHVENAFGASMYDDKHGGFFGLIILITLPNILKKR